jgi:hypothetical protein
MLRYSNCRLQCRRDEARQRMMTRKLFESTPGWPSPKPITTVSRDCTVLADRVLCHVGSVDRIIHSIF